MVSAHDSEPARLIEKTAEELKKEIDMPQWAAFVKTGVSRERVPEQENWWHIRSASILRRIYLDGPIGLQKLRSHYGGRHRRGHKPAHFAKGGGKIIRTILQQLEERGLVEKEGKKGRKVTSKGQKFLDGIAKQVK